MLKMELSEKEVDAAVKPCPFCGNSQKLFITDEKLYRELVEENGSSLIGISCNVCNTTQRLYSIPDNNYWMGVGMLISKWNTRHGKDK